MTVQRHNIIPLIRKDQSNIDELLVERAFIGGYFCMYLELTEVFTDMHVFHNWFQKYYIDGGVARTPVKPLRNWQLASMIMSMTRVGHYRHNGQEWVYTTPAVETIVTVFVNGSPLGEADFDPLQTVPIFYYSVEMRKMMLDRILKRY